MATVKKSFIVKSGIIIALLYYAMCPAKVLSPEAYSGLETVKNKTPLEAKIEDSILQTQKVSSVEARSITVSVLKWSKSFEVDPTLVLGVIAVESAFKKHAISSVGAFGLMQVLPRWHTDKIKVAKKELGNPEVFDIDTNIYLGTWILKDCMSKYKNTSTALKCYNGSVGKNTDYHIKVLKAKNDFRGKIVT